jgi:hypothetical protein
VSNSDSLENYEVYVSDSYSCPTPTPKETIKSKYGISDIHNYPLGLHP